jgi:hypothetical protein
MMTRELGRLEKVSLREVWLTEDRDFTPWLAAENNLALISEAIQLELELESTEKEVGPFRADILCKDTLTNSYVLIENQLERTDHRHLGQLMTYAAGLDAVTIVWVAEHFTEEHRAALDWLNKITGEGINFFGLEVELWRIGDSVAAPKFNIVSKPNSWTKAIASARQSAETHLTETKELHLEYWTAFCEKLESEGTTLQIRSPRPQHWQLFAIGRTGFRISVLTGMRDGYLGVQLEMYDDDAKPHFHLLYDKRETFEAAFGQVLEWRELPDRKQSHIAVFRYDVDPTDKSNWDEYQTWHKEKTEKFHNVFSDTIRTLDASEYIWPDDEQNLNG